MKQSLVVIVSCVAIAILTTAEQARSAGFDNNNVGLRGFALATAYHGIADDGSAIYYNPAGLALIDEGQMNVEAYAYAIFTKFKYSATTPAGTTKAESTEIPVIPGGFISQSFDRWGLGLGVFAPYGGGGVVYKDFFTTTGDSLEASAGFFALAPSLALEVVRKYLSVGVSPTIYFGVMENKMNPAEDLTGETRVTSKNSGYAGYGASIGLMSAPLPELKIGLTWRTPVKIKMDGTVTTESPRLPEAMKSDSTMKFMLPMELTLGVGVFPIKKLTIGFSATLIFHGMMDKITMRTTAMSATGQEMEVVTESETNYKHNFRVALGVEYEIIKQLAVRAGIQFIQSPTKDKGLVLTSCDTNQFLPTLGVAWRIVRFLELTVSGEYVMGFERKRESEMAIPGDTTGATIPLEEKFDADHWVVLGGLRFYWDFIK